MEADVKKNVFQCITRMKIKAGQSARFPFLLSFLEFFFWLWCITSYSEIIHHGNFSNVTLTPLAEDPTYPYLRTLLQFDTREFLNVLALVSVEELFSQNHKIKNRKYFSLVKISIGTECEKYICMTVSYMYGMNSYIHKLNVSVLCIPWSYVFKES